MTGTRERPNAPADVLKYWNERKSRIVSSFDYRDIFAHEHVQAFTVAKAMRADVLETLRDAVDTAIKDGTTFDQFKKELTPKLQNLGWWGKSLEVDPDTGETVVAQLGSPRRLKTIYTSNLRTARTAGFWMRVQRTKRALPFLMYMLGPSEVHRKHHVIHEGKIYPVEHTFWLYYLGPNGYGCKCWVRQLSRAEAERLGGVSPEPDIEFRQYTNKRTGEVIKVPKGIDPGWHTNPGKSHLDFVASGRKLSESLKAIVRTNEDLQTASQLRRKMASGFMASPALDNVVARSRDFDEMDDQAKREIGRLAAPVAVLSGERATDIGAKSALVLLSVETIAKQLRKSGETGRLDFEILQTLIEEGLLKPDRKELHWIVAGNYGGNWYRATLKRTQNGEEIYLQSLRHAKDDEIAREFIFE